MDKTMKRAVWKKPHPGKINNRAMNRTRSLVEQPFEVIERMFHSRYFMVTTLFCVHGKNSDVVHNVSSHYSFCTTFLNFFSGMQFLLLLTPEILL
jgi:hypothetical protein